MASPLNVDMLEVTRLTRAGRLREAVQMLQGRGGSRAPRAVPQAGGNAGEPTPPTIDLSAPRRSGEGWTMPSLAAGASGLTRVLGEQLPNLSAIPASRGGLGSLRRTPTPTPDGTRFEERTFASAIGERAYKVFVPSAYTGQALPLVVMLHGCTQTPDDFAAGTRMNALAEEETFLVAYPAQSRTANAQRCWNWFNEHDQRRETGEPALIAGIARAVIREFAADPVRVYVAGLSAGGAAAAVLAATHPDLFAAVGIHSGLPCGAARDVPSAFAATRGDAPAPAAGSAKSIPTIVFHGDADRTVSAINGQRIVERAKVEESSDLVTEGVSAGGMSYTRVVRCDASGRAALEHWILHGAGHAWSGGSSDGSYTDPRGPDASREMMRFFLAHTNATRQEARS